jgi:hypothetical protein
LGGPVEKGDDEEVTDYPAHDGAKDAQAWGRDSSGGERVIGIFDVTHFRFAPAADDRRRESFATDGIAAFGGVIPELRLGGNEIAADSSGVGELTKMLTAEVRVRGCYGGD